MSEFQNRNNRDRKYYLNLIYFILSTIYVTVIWPHGSKDGLLKITGILILVASCYTVLWLFLTHFRQEVLGVTRKTLFVILVINTFVTLTRLSITLSFHDVLYLIPVVIIPVVIMTFYDARLALFILLITLMLSGFMIENPFDFIFMSFVSGMMAIFSLSDIYRKARFLTTSLIVILTYWVLYIGLSVVRSDSLPAIAWSDFILFVINGLLVLISYPLILVFEKRFLFLSDATLLELADTNQPLLRKLAIEAPGSFQHSLQVANLAEEAARVTGANVLLVRTGALYHDIGKIANPGYYIENQTEGKSPHDDLSPEDSAKVIINHVRNGVNLAKNFKLPVQIIDFIRTHHGTTVAYYFFRKFTELYPWDTSRESDFTYPGPKPFSKETAVVMMADAVEASSRSMTSHTEENISELVERIVYLQEQDGQFSEVPLTFRDISDIKTAFKKRLLNIYHLRVAYPERNTNLSQDFTLYH